MLRFVNTLCNGAETKLANKTGQVLTKSAATIQEKLTATKTELPSGAPSKPHPEKRDYYVIWRRGGSDIVNKEELSGPMTWKNAHKTVAEEAKKRRMREISQQQDELPELMGKMRHNFNK